MKDLFVYFDGDETERQFLEKCYRQWSLACEAESDTQKLIILGSLFAEIRHRISEIDC